MTSVTRSVTNMVTVVTMVSVVTVVTMVIMTAMVTTPCYHSYYQGVFCDECDTLNKRYCFEKRCDR